MNVINAVKFVGTNYVVILQGVAAILSSLGIICEAVNRIMPNKGDESAVTKIGKEIAVAGTYVQKTMNLLKVPNVVKEEIRDNKAS